MPIAKVKMPDGRIARLEVPEGTTPEQVMEFVQKIRPSAPQQEEKYSALGTDEDTLQVYNPFGKNIDTGVNIGADFSNFLAGAGKSFADTAQGVRQIFGSDNTADVEERRRLDAELMDTKAGVSGNIAGGAAQLAPAMFIPGANTAVGSGLIGAGWSALGPVGEGESRGRNAAIGAALGVAGNKAGKYIGKGVSSASKRIANIERKVAEKAAAQAASETASARSAAGSAAQNAYRQLEHLRELKALRGLAPEEALIAKELEKELSQKAAEKLIPAAALKKATAQAYREAIETESERAAKLTAEKLSGKEVKSQIMARLKRYGPAALGGMAGNMLFPGLGGAVGGAATGLVLRPAIHSMRRLAQNPAVQRQMLMPIANSGLLSNPNLPKIMGLLGPLVYSSQE